MSVNCIEFQNKLPEFAAFYNNSKKINTKVLEKIWVKIDVKEPKGTKTTNFLIDIIFPQEKQGKLLLSN